MPIVTVIMAFVNVRLVWTEKPVTIGTLMDVLVLQPDALKTLNPSVTLPDTPAM